MDYLVRQKALFTKDERRQLKGLVVLIAGAGGLGTHQLIELQRIGISKIYLVDYDKIEPSNLNRQVLYGRNDLGLYKVDQAKRRLAEYQLGTDIINIKERITQDFQLPEDVQLVFDALDNFQTRFILEKIVAGQGIPLIHGGVNGWHGQLTTIIPGKSKTLADLFNTQSARDKAKGNIEPLPVFSPVVSVIASLQVIEGINVFLGRDNNLINKLMLVDLQTYSIELIDL